MGTNASFIDDLLQLLPQLKPIYDEHLADNDTLLPHVFMGDVTRFAVAEAAKPTSRHILERLLGHLELGLENGSEQVKELVVVSFVENLIGETVALKAIKPLMGPKLKKEVEAICGE
jgi:hypothetical protein